MHFDRKLLYLPESDAERGRTRGRAKNKMAVAERAMSGAKAGSLSPRPPAPLLL